LKLGKGPETASEKPLRERLKAKRQRGDHKLLLREENDRRGGGLTGRWLATQRGGPFCTYKGDAFKGKGKKDPSKKDFR